MGKGDVVGRQRVGHDNYPNASFRQSPHLVDGLAGWDEVWGYESFPTTRTVDNYILSLRKKLEDDPSSPKHLLTLHKSGYKFIADP